MNNARRRVLHKVLRELERLRDPIDKTTALSILSDAAKKVEMTMDDEEMCVDARPENLMWSDLTEKMRDCVSDLSDAHCELECVLDDCKKMTEFDYSAIQKDMDKAVKSINQAIYR